MKEQKTTAGEQKVENKEAGSTLSTRRIILPLAFGVLAAAYVLYTVDLNMAAESFMNSNFFWIGAAFFVLLARDAGYIYRIRYLTDKALSWKASAYVILLWEFSSAVTPSVVGGTPVAIFILNREGIPFGKALAYAMLSAMLDNMFFIVAAPLAMIFAQESIFPNLGEFSGQFDSGVLQYGLEYAFWISYALIVLYTSFFAFGLFIKPQGFRWLLVKIASFGFLRRWESRMVKTGDEVVLAAKELNGLDIVYWLRASFSTLFVWIARYFMLNCLIAAFVALNAADHLLVFGRQIVMWIVMLISPTPGSSGAAELVFPAFYGAFLNIELSKVVGLFWRLFYYYPYLFIGAIILPAWLRRSQRLMKNRKEQEEQKDSKTPEI